VLDQERHVEPDERGPEVQLPELLVQEPPGHLREPEIEPPGHRTSTALRLQITTNTKIRLITRIAFGFKSPDALIAMAMLSLGGHRPPCPTGNDPRKQQESPKAGTLAPCWSCK